MVNNDVDNEEYKYSYEDPYSYLKSEYLRLNYKKHTLMGINLDDYFEINQNIYGNNERELFESDKILFQQLKEMSEKLDLPIDEQDDSTFWLLNRHSNIVTKVMKENNIILNQNIILGTLPINDLNALTCEFSENERLVALNQGLFQFVYLMGRMISSLFLEIDNNKTKNSLNFNLKIKPIDGKIKFDKGDNEKFLEVLTLYFVYENLFKSKTYFEKDKNMILSACLWDNAELFVVAHEYAHISMDELSNKKDMKRRFLDDDSKLYEVIRDWNEEFKADQIALQIILTRSDDFDSGLVGNYLGVEFLFACIDIIERINVKINGEKLSETHPSARIRIENLRKFLKVILPKNADNLINGSKIISDILMELWEQNEETFYKLYKTKK